MKLYLCLFPEGISGDTDPLILNSAVDEDWCCLDCGRGRSIHSSMAGKPLLGLAFLRRCLHYSLSSARLLHPRISRFCGVSLRMTSSHVLILRARMPMLRFWTVVGLFMYQKSNPFLIAKLFAVYQSFQSNLWGFFNINCFAGWDQPHAQPPTWRTGVSVFVWVITLDLSGMGGPTSNYATASIVPWLIRSLKPHHRLEGLAIPRWGGGI